MSDEKIDFSPLDPSGDPRRWEALIARTTERAMAARARAPASLTFELARLSWPLTTAAALVAAVALVLASLSPRTGGALSVDSVSEWANTGEVPRTVDVVALTGEVP